MCGGDWSELYILIWRCMCVYSRGETVGERERERERESERENVNTWSLSLSSSFLSSVQARK